MKKYTIQNTERKSSEIFKDWLTTNLLEKTKNDHEIYFCRREVNFLMKFRIIFVLNFFGKITCFQTLLSL